MPKKAVHTESDDKRRKPTAVTGLQIVEHLAQNPRGSRLKEIATAVQMDPGQTHRMLAAMVSDGWIIPVDDNGTYSLSARAIKLGATYISRLDIADHAQPLMDALFVTTGESVFLGELRGDVVVCVARRVADRTLRVWTELGNSWPMAGSAMGGAVMAARAMHHPKVESDELLEEVAIALKAGFAHDFGRYREGVKSVAAPVHNAEGAVVAALAISGPVTRLSDDDVERFGRLVLHAAISISERMGCLNHPFRHLVTES